MDHIRKATVEDISRIAEILIFTKRMNYRPIFRNDKVSFGEMQVLPLAQDYIDHPEKLENIWVYEDEFVKGMLHAEEQELLELYVDSFFQNEGIGSKLMKFAIDKLEVRSLNVLEKNKNAIRFYQRHGFVLTQEKQLEQGTNEFVVKMKR